MKNGFASKAYKQVTCTWICQLNNQIKHWVDVNTEASIVEHGQDYHFSEKGKKKKIFCSFMWVLHSSITTNVVILMWGNTKTNWKTYNDPFMNPVQIVVHMSEGI